MAISKTELSRQDKSETQKRLDRHDMFMAAIVLVTLLGFITLLFAVISMILSSQHDNSQSYRDYRDELRQQNNKIDTLTNELRYQRESAALKRSESK